MPGHFTRTDADRSIGMLSSGLQMARSLDLPPSLKFLLRSDSTLTTYATPGGIAEGMGQYSKSILHHLKQAHPKYDWDSAIMNGQSLTDLHASLPKDPKRELGL